MTVVVPLTLRIKRVKKTHAAVVEVLYEIVDANGAVVYAREFTTLPENVEAVARYTVDRLTAQAAVSALVAIDAAARASIKIAVHDDSGGGDGDEDGLGSIDAIYSNAAVARENILKSGKVQMPDDYKYTKTRKAASVEATVVGPPDQVLSPVGVKRTRR